MTSRLITCCLQFSLLCAVAAAVAPAPALAATAIETSPNDDREYRQITLANGLKVTLIRDENTDMAAAAMDVAVGAGSDPRDRPGLAHFLEHMLFLGTEKYPEADAYARFIQQHGGSNNAYTTFANTNYFFAIDAAQLEPALDRFAQFFIAPLFNETLVQREKNAVHSEFTGKRREEGLRFYSARKQGFNPQHPMTGFTTGNLQTLADRPGSDIRQELIDFYQTYYSANIMSLAIAGREPLDQLESWAASKFATIKNRQTKKQSFDTPLFSPEQLSSSINIQPLTDQRFLILTFPVKTHPEYRFSRPRSYIGNVLGHEGPGSLLSELKRLGWANALSAGGGTQTRKSSSFEVSIGLTEAGTQHIDEVVETVFAAIARLKQSGLPQWLFDENELINELSFRYQEKSSTANLVRALSVRAQDWPAQKLLSGPYRRSHFDVEGIRTMLDQLTPENMQLVVVYPSIDTDETTPWYDAPYSIRDIPNDTIRQWQSVAPNAQITMPQPNRFLPQDLSMRANGDGSPIKLIDTPRLQVWHRTDSSFGVPRANLKANIHLPLSVSSAKNSVLNELYARLVNEQLREFSYAANLVGLGVGLRTNSRGLSLNVAGYADGQTRMLQNIVKVMADLEIDARLFEEIRQELTEEIYSDVHDAPYKQTAARTYQLLYTPYFTDEQRLSALEDIEPPQLQQYAESLFDEARVVLLSHGNLTGTETLSRVDILMNPLFTNARAASVERFKMVALPPGDEYLDTVTLDHADSSLSLYIQGLTRDRASRAQFAVLRQLLSQPLYAELRTRQQLGYFVFTYSIDLIQVPSVVIALQSPVAKPAQLYAAVENFLNSFEATLQSLSEEEFQQNLQAVIAQVEEQDSRLQHRTNRFWGAIVREDFRFDASELFADELRKVSKAQILNLYQKLFIEKQNGRLIVASAGNSPTNNTENDEDFLAGLQRVDNLESFQSGKTLLPPLSEVTGVE